MCIRRHQAFAMVPVRGRRFRVYEYKETPGFRPSPRERVRERCFRLYKEAPGFRPDPRKSETIPRV